VVAGAVRRAEGVSGEEWREVPGTGRSDTARWVDQRPAQGVQKGPETPVCRPHRTPGEAARVDVECQGRQDQQNRRHGIQIRPKKRRLSEADTSNETIGDEGETCSDIETDLEDIDDG
jgi:hypothetical protein